MAAWTDAPTAPPETSDARARRLEAAGDWPGALAAYEAALAETPDEVELLCGLARIARRLDMPQQALALWAEVAARAPERLEAVDGRARALADLHRHGEAVEHLRAAILAHPHEARLWNALGVLVNETGDSLAAHSVFDEAVRLDPDLAPALYNRGDVRFDLGELEGARADFDAAARHARDPGETATIAFAQALLHLHKGELEPGWNAYEARLHPDLPAAPVFHAPGECWTPQAPLAGAHLLLVGEQGVGDEVMFISLVPDVLAALGPTGRLSLALDRRLHPLARRSFPDVEILPYATERRGGRTHRRVEAPAGPPSARAIDLWAPLGSLPGRFRRTIESFAPAAPYLAPDPNRVAHWRAWLQAAAGPGARVIGLSWRSGLTAGRRARHAPALADFAQVLRADGLRAGARVVQLQYGAREEELATLDALGPALLLRPPGIDLREDLDDLAALCLALDFVLTVPNATAALAAACGAPTWFLTSPNAWPRLGTNDYPWYAHAQSFAAERFGAWGEVVERVAARGLWFERPGIPNT